MSNLYLVFAMASISQTPIYLKNKRLIPYLLFEYKTTLMHALQCATRNKVTLTHAWGWSKWSLLKALETENNG